MAHVIINLKKRYGRELSMAQQLKSKEIIIQKIKKIIQSHEEIIFAYLFGSFTEQEIYNDLDLAIYCNENHPRVSDLFYDVSLSREIEKALQIPVDIIVLNHAPDRLVYRASKGYLLKDKNQALRSDFLLYRWKKYLDFQEVLKKYRQELKNVSR
jgi:hypothetical protein